MQLKLFGQQRNTCINHLTNVLDQSTLDECMEMMKRVKEARKKDFGMIKVQVPEIVPTE